jgi:hypothetical protein
MFTEKNPFQKCTQVFMKHPHCKISKFKETRNHNATVAVTAPLSITPSPGNIVDATLLAFLLSVRHPVWDS